MENQTKHKIGDYNIQYKRCKHCNYNPGKSKKNRCWRCGRKLERDFSITALKKHNQKENKS